MEEKKSATDVGKILSRWLSVLFASGVLVYAVSIYGTVFYQGYISKLGFDYALFPISYSDSYLWAYVASLDLVSWLFSFGTKYAFYIFAGIILASFLFFVCRDFFNNQTDERPKSSIWFENNYPSFYQGLKKFVFSRFLERFESSLMVVQLFNVLAFAVCLWLLIPALALKHGRHVGEERLEHYVDQLCEKADDDWNWCLPLEYEGQEIAARLIVKNGDLLGVYTKDGPVTLTAPEDLGFIRVKNKE